MSDNGLEYVSTREPEIRPYLPLRGNKMTLWEGGILESLFVSDSGIHKQGQYPSSVFRLVDYKRIHYKIII